MTESSKKLNIQELKQSPSWISGGGQLKKNQRKKYETGKLEMERLKIDVLVSTAVVGGNAGVGIILSKKFERRAKGYIQYNERGIMFKLIKIIQAYMPTTDHDDEQVGETYDHINELIKNVREDENLITLEVEVDEERDGILKSEFYKVLDLKDGKALDTDDIPAEVIKNLGERVLQNPFQLVTNIYKTGEMPTDLTKNVVISIPKKAKSYECDKHRIMSLTTHASKILTRIIRKRIEKL
ncbi:hypothetical protein ILUMI_15615 [Ignelater luminosus]|uniref:Uncharacterized protein n=1 Tax=Ignelater luminosus TaxID=2038154 RepID=A0A8K0CN91_IGNLU|nr:hypothetical protein ILUMI_15615 [Ignelater luminosus]